MSAKQPDRPEGAAAPQQRDMREPDRAAPGGQEDGVPHREETAADRPGKAAAGPGSAAPFAAPSPGESARLSSPLATPPSVTAPALSSALSSGISAAAPAEMPSSSAPSAAGPPPGGGADDGMAGGDVAPSAAGAGDAPGRTGAAVAGSGAPPDFAAAHISASDPASDSVPDPAPDPAMAATQAQRRSAAPDDSVWVGASAGSGKTKVLTDRVLRLLLPRADGRPGTAPHRILCLTFTKAAAQEMALRLGKVLGGWAVMADGALDEALQDSLLGHPPTAAQRAAARRLFAQVIDTPGGLKIMTIHAFCQSVLSRFPLEAGLPPHFKALEDGDAKALLSRARDETAAQARRAPASPEGRALAALAAAQGAEGFTRLMQDIVGERHQLAALLAREGGLDGAMTALARHLGVAPGDTPEALLAAACADGAFDEAGLRAACRAMALHGTEKTDQPKAVAIQNWLDAGPGERAALYDSYRAQYLKKDGGILKSLMTKKLAGDNPAEERALQAEAERLFALEDRMRAATCAALTHGLLTLGTAVLARYEAAKRQRAALDFDDLIHRTLGLLAREKMAGWVMFKLDGGLDHILIDEAQDTNPEQWEIVKALSDEFFAGKGAREDVERTIFSVGDEKQSIYSFQRAAPEKFREMRAHFREKITVAGARWRDEDMNVSFRSVPAVLSFVDSVFADEHVRRGLGEARLAHRSNRTLDGGIVEVWPLFETPETDRADPWRAAATPVGGASGAMMLAERIGQTVRDWLDRGEALASSGRPVRPGDIMVLVRRRTAFVNQLIRALKTRDIPVSGVDRMVLKEQLAVQDMLALAQCALLYADDLALACVLKSPLVGWDDAQLEVLAARRPPGVRLWEALEAAARDVPDAVGPSDVPGAAAGQMAGPAGKGAAGDNVANGVADGVASGMAGHAGNGRAAGHTATADHGAAKVSGDAAGAVIGAAIGDGAAAGAYVREDEAARDGIGDTALGAAADMARGEAGNVADGLPGLAGIYRWLRAQQEQAGRESPYAFFSRVLHEPCPGDATGGLHAMTGRLGIEVLDPLDEFLNMALDYEAAHVPALQGFLLWTAQGDSEIKRQQEEAGGRVRIMTVHGAKGLQAPIVFLPDTVRTARTPPGASAHRLLWPDKTGWAAPVWSPRQDMDCIAYQRLLYAYEQRQDEEYRRLLYVALTRAEDRLYIAGYQGARKPLEESWYHYARAGLARMEGTAEAPFALPPGMEGPGIMLRREEAQRGPARGKKAHQAADETPAAAARYPWLLRPAPPEPDPTRPLAPTRPSGEEPAALSPLEALDNHRFRRGIVTHRLLQLLPDLPPDGRRSAALAFAARHAADLPEDVQAQIVAETLAVIAHPDWGALFGPGSRAEVPLTGMVRRGDSAVLVSGRIDRLLVRPDEVWIVDYKTNRPPPASEAGVPPVYREQMAAYGDIVASIYPGRRVRGILLWTDGPLLMPLAG